MAFSPVPKDSKNQINKAGQALVENNAPPGDLQQARELAGTWRACHAYPINTFQSTLRDKIKRLSLASIVAQRLKRMPTIIDKLKRYPAMKLTTMQDIGGVRAILDSVQDVYKLANEYRQSQQFAHKLIDEKDYIQNPRNEDGYRSLHLIYRYKNKQASEYDGLRVELQIRTKLQHTWATAVETMGTFLGQALKSRQGDQEWLDFFAIVSAAFAHKENSVPVPRYKHLSMDQTFQAVATAETRLGALERMRGFSVAVDAIAKKKGGGKKSFYHLIILNSEKGVVQIKPYDRDSFEQAVVDYGKAEAQAAQGKRIEPVLVSAGPIDKLRRAYPNFFLDINEFVEIVDPMVSAVKR